MIRSKASADVSGSACASTAFAAGGRGRRLPAFGAADFWRLLAELADRAAAELAACARACCAWSGSGIVDRDRKAPKSSCTSSWAS